jgi:hypothetical protein
MGLDKTVKVVLFIEGIVWMQIVSFLTRLNISYVMLRCNVSFKGCCSQRLSHASKNKWHHIQNTVCRMEITNMRDYLRLKLARKLIKFKNPNNIFT